MRLAGPGTNPEEDPRCSSYPARSGSLLAPHVSCVDVPPTSAAVNGDGVAGGRLSTEWPESGSEAQPMPSELLRVSTMYTVFAGPAAAESATVLTVRLYAGNPLPV